MMELHVCSKSGALLRSYALGDNTEILVGRDERCDVRILAKSVSREHCAIEHREGSLVLRDLGSSGGTFVDGNRVTTVPVSDGLTVDVGPAVLRFHEGDR